MMKGLNGIRVVEAGGAAAMPLVGMLMGSWGADVIHVEPPGRGDMHRTFLKEGASGWAKPNRINYLWEHVDRNKRSIAINMSKPEGQAILHRLISKSDVFLNNLRPYELEKFRLEYKTLAAMNPRIISANLTGYGQKGPEKDTGGYDSVAFWARSGVMDLMHDADSAPNISRPAYGDSITSLSLLAGVMSALFMRERTGAGQEVQVSLFNTATYVLGYDITGCLITGEDSVRPQRKNMGNPLRNIYGTQDGRWIMLGMTNAQHYWPAFCKALNKPELENDPKFATFDLRTRNSEELVSIISDIFKGKTYAEWITILQANHLIWSPVKTPLEVTQDEQALANDFFVKWEHPEYGNIRMLNNPIKLSNTPAENKMRAPKLGEHTNEILQELGISETEILKMRESGIVG